MQSFKILFINTFRSNWKLSHCKVTKTKHEVHCLNRMSVILFQKYGKIN